MSENTPDARPPGSGQPIEIVILTSESDRKRWERLPANILPTVIQDVSELAEFLAERPVVAVAICLPHLEISEPETVDIADIVRIRSSAALLLEGTFELGQPLPGRADAHFPPGASNDAILLAVDAGIRQVRARRAASNDRAFVESLLSSNQTLALAIDRDTKVREYNHAAEVVTGYSLAEVFGRPLGELLVNDRGLAGILGATRRDELPKDLVLDFRTEQGEVRSVECEFSPFFDDTGNIRFIVVTGIDITAQLKFETILEDSEEAFRRLIESTPDSVFVITLPHGAFAYANPAGLKFLGAPSYEEMKDWDGLAMIAPDFRDDALERIRQVVQTGRPQSATELKLLLPDGEPAWVETVEIPIRYKGRDSVLAILRDLTQRKELTARMMQLDRMVAVGTLAAGVGHEINNPLAYLMSNIEYASDEIRDARESENVQNLDEVILALEEAQDGATRVRDIVRDLKDLSRVDDDRIEPVDLEALLESALNVSWHEIRTRASVRRDFQPVPLVHGAGGRVRQLFVNVLINAAQSMEGADPADSVIKLEIGPAHDGDFVRVAVIDEGTGISEDNIRRVFDPFYTTKLVGTGTGLGLTIAHRIINSVGGSMTLKSELGVGTTVEMLFEPISSEVSEAEEANPSHQVPLRLLLIDDEPMIANSIRRALVEASEVVSFGAGQEALEHLEDDRDFDVILCDLVMPGMAGPEFHHRVAQRWPDLEARIVFMTGGAYSDDIGSFARQYESRLLEKPFAAWDLREALYEAALS